ncbi:uncharacterized protein F5147DRAFT_657344 [Suillus discolor]|uniref:Uncharacterized protein n=1 Tax=Suillus discolor TaxID=1912936 RepID=A0A9P7EX86_9AGAM|nr:uncharacterized protein F5147DRAFT_657344 [Suillus discolor]KAG2093722.1 hypothetical protein F5147DRAFT_657344 [Suillus discolor]
MENDVEPDLVLHSIPNLVSADIHLPSLHALHSYTCTQLALAYEEVNDYASYMTYKQRTFNLEGKLNSQWSRDLGATGRLRIQNKLHCCGYYSPFVEATVSQSCYARSVLPGCKEAYVNFEKCALDFWYTIAFPLVPLQLVIMLAGLLCSNHVTYRFGKGMMPKAYRLSMASMAVIMDNYANQLAEQYGSEIASDILARSWHLDSVTYASGVANGTGTTYALSQGSCRMLAARS